MHLLCDWLVFRIFHSGFSQAAAIPGASLSHTGKVFASRQEALGQCPLTLNLADMDLNL